MSMRPAVIILVTVALALGGTVGAQTPERRTVLDNESVRVTVITHQPGGGSGRHLGLEPELGMVLEGELTLETPNGRETFKAGSVFWVPSLTPHDARNEGDRPVRYMDVILKRCE